jgi:hypothetical protein
VESKSSNGTNKTHWVGSARGILHLDQSMLTWSITSYGDFSIQRTASFRGQNLSVLWLWREERWTNYNQFELTRSGGSFVLPDSTVVRYKNATSEDMEKMVEFGKRQRNSTPRPQVLGWFDGEYKGDDFNRTHYVCLDTGITSSPILGVECYSRDGHWMVSFFGPKQSLSEFEMILHGVASMGNPTK